MTDLASLKIKIDASEVDPAAAGLDKLAASGKNAESATNRAGKEWVRASSAAGKLRIEEWAAAQAADKLSTSARGAGAAASKMAADAQKAAAGMGSVAKASGLAAHHTQNLVFQLQDIAVGLASGQKPMTVFLQQGAQIQGIMSQAGIGVAGLAKEIGALALRFAPAAVVAGSFAGALKIITDDINENSKVTVTWGDVMMGTFDAVTSYLSGKVSQAFGYFGTSVGEVWDWTASASKKWANFVIGTIVAVPSALIAGWRTFPQAFADLMLNAANAAIGMFERMVNNFINGINTVIGMVKSVTGADIGSVKNITFDRIENTYAGSFSKMGKDMGAAFVGAYKDYVGQAIEFISPFAEKRARDRLEKDAEKAGRGAGSKLGKSMAKEAQMSFAEAFRDFQDDIKRIDELTALGSKSQEHIAQLEREAQVIGLVGAARERELKVLEYKAQIDPLMAQLRDAEIAGNRVLIDQLRVVIATKEKERDLDLSNTDRAAQIEAERLATEKLNDELRNTIQILQQIGGFAGVLGDVLGFVSGDYGSIGGKFGRLLNMGTGGTRIDAKTGEVVAEKIGDQLRDVFGANGVFSAGLTQALQAAGIGAAVGSAVDGVMDKLGIKSSNTGAQIGGAAGMAAFGPIGAIAGSIIGGLVGGLFKSTKKGVATFTGSGADFGITNSGNSDKRIAAANEAADSIITAMKDIADKLNGTVDAALASVSIGVRNKKWVVDTTGQGRTKGSGVLKFDTEEEAVSAAIQDMINDGVIKGIRESTMRLLKAGGDLQSNLQKALDFENVFQSLAASTNPLKAALDQIQKEFEYLTEVFKQAGASAEEYAQLQEYIAKAQQAAIDSASANYRANFYTDAENEAYARKQIDTQMVALGYNSGMSVADYKRAVEAIDTSTEEGLEKYGALMELSDEFATLQQAQQAKAEAAAQAAADAQNLANQKKAMEVELLRLQGKEEQALSKERQLALDGLDSSLRSLQQEIFKYQDIADAKDVLREAYERESSALQDTIDKFKAFSDTLRDFRDSLYASDTSATSYTQRLAKLMQVGALASTGDEKALGDLPGVGKDFLEAALNRAGSAQDYARQVAMVARYADDAIKASDGQMTIAEQQLDQMKSQVGALIDINESVISVQQAIERLNALLAPSGSSGSGSGTSASTGLTDSRLETGRGYGHGAGGWWTNRDNDMTGERISSQLQGLATEMAQTSRNTALFTRILDRVTRNGTSLAVATDSDTPLQVTTP